MARHILVALIAFVPTVAIAQERLSSDVLKATKAATVLVKVKEKQSLTERFGSGFVLRSDAGVVWIVTNEQIVQPQTNNTRLRPSSPGLRPLTAPPPSDLATVSVVFDSGRGSERVAPVAMFATDSSLGLALLRIEKLKDPPKPIPLDEKIEISETMPIFAFGYPLGAEAPDDRTNPAVTICKRSVSSIRENQSGRPIRVQIDGELNVGYAGGPVIDAQGNLVGVAISKLVRTQFGSAIPFTAVIPPAEISELLNGRCSGVNVETLEVDNEKGTAEARIEVTFADPLGKVTKPFILFAHSDELQEQPKADKKNGVWPPLPGSKEFALKMADGKAVGTIAINIKGKAAPRVTIQPGYSTQSGDVVYCEPTEPYPLALRPNQPVRSKIAAKPEPDSTPTNAKVGAMKATPHTIGTLGGVGQIVWAIDGKAFYHLEKKGTLRRIAYPSYKEEVVAEFETECAWLGVSAEGVVVSVPYKQELQVLDPTTLKVVRKIEIEKATRFATSAESSFAYLGDGVRFRGKLRAVDLKAAKIAAEYETKLFGKDVGFETPSLTPNGKFLYATGGIEQIYRYGVDREKVVFEEESPRILQAFSGDLCISPNSKYVAGPCGGGNYAIESIARKAYATYLFTPESLERPAIVLESGAYPRAVGYDSTAGLIYAQNHEYPLIVFNAKGVLLKEYKIDGASESLRGVYQFLTDPAGRKVIVLVRDLGGRKPDVAYHVELPAP